MEINLFQEIGNLSNISSKWVEFKESKWLQTATIKIFDNENEYFKNKKGEN